MPWDASIDSAGHVTGRDPKDLPTADVAALARAVDDAGFFALKPSLGALGVTCGDFCTLKVTKGGRTHEVTVYFRQAVAKDPEVRRFNAVWDAVLKRIPSPNRGWAPAPPRPYSGSAAPFSIHSRIFRANSSCESGGFVRPSPGSQPPRTSLSSVTWWRICSSVLCPF